MAILVDPSRTNDRSYDIMIFDSISDALNDDNVGFFFPDVAIGSMIKIVGFAIRGQETQMTERYIHVSAEYKFAASDNFLIFK